MERNSIHLTVRKEVVYTSRNDLHRISSLFTVLLTIDLSTKIHADSYDNVII